MHLCKRFHVGPYGLGMLVLVVVAAVLRLVLIRNNWPAPYSDEGTIDLMALHIAYRGEHPIFYYGQAYMGPLEAYIGALLFHVFGPSVFVVRLGLIALYILFLICMYFLTRLLYTKGLALATLTLLSLGSRETLLYQLRAIGGYAEVVLLGVLMFLIVAHLALTSDQANISGKTALIGTGEGKRRRRWLLYGALGFVIGFALWTDQLILPCVATSMLLLLLFCRHELRRLPGLILLLGLIIGALPLIGYNITAPFGRSSLNILLDLQHSGASQMAARHIPFIQQPLGALLIGLPTITGFNPLCTVENFPLFGSGTGQTLSCTLQQASWSLGYLILWSIAVVMAGRLLWWQWQHNRQAWLSILREDTNRATNSHKEPLSFPQQALSFEERRERIRQCIRLMLLASAGLTLLLYAISPPAALVPGPTARYLICMQIATPAVLWPLWQQIGKRPIRSIRRGTIGWVCRVGLLLFITTMLLMGTIRTFQDIPNAQAAYNRQEALIHDLLHIGATRIYTDYWTCNRLIFQSNEQIICSNLDENLKPALDRYAPYKEIVKAAPGTTYVFLSDSPQVTAIERIVQERHLSYRRYVFDGYVVYRMDSQVEAVEHVEPVSVPSTYVPTRQQIHKIKFS